MAAALRLPARLRARPPRRADEAAGAGHKLSAAAATLAGAVLLDSGLEHYVGAFQNPVMVTPLASASAALAASLHGTLDPTGASRRRRDGAFAAAILSGLIGTGFHLYNVGKRPGRFSWRNLFYAAPLGAPAALLLAGVVGFAVERVRESGARVARGLAALTAVGLAGSVGEAGLFHFRGAFQNPLMFAPVSLPPVSAALLARAAASPNAGPRPLTRWALRLTAGLGLVGVGLHAFGVSRQMGGWRNWTQNLMSGPPLPAPPAFTGLAIAGLAALDLLEADRT